MQADSDDLDHRSRDSPPLASVRRASGKLNLAASTASTEAAENLLAKAQIRLQRGDPDAARPYVERALKLPFDTHEEAIPAVWSAHMQLFIAISDDLEECEDGDHSWLHRAELLIERSSPVAATEVRHCLRDLMDGALPLSAKELKKLTQLTVGIPFDADPLPGVGEGTPQVDAIIEVLRAILDHEELMYGPA